MPGSVNSADDRIFRFEQNVLLTKFRNRLLTLLYGAGLPCTVNECDHGNCAILPQTGKTTLKNTDMSNIDSMGSNYFTTL